MLSSSRLVATIALIAIVGMPSLAMACPNNCGGIGVCLYNVCQCPLGVWGVDCNVTITTSTPNYVAFRIIFLVAFSIALLAGIKPLYVLTLHKIGQLRTSFNDTLASRVSQFIRDERYLCLVFLMVGNISFILNFIDPTGIEGITSPKFQLDTIIVGGTFQVLAAAASVRLFIALQASFCHVTRKSVGIFDIITACFLIMEFGAIGMSANWTLYGIALVQLVASVGHGAFLLIVTLAASLYSITILKTLLMRAPGEERIKTLTRSMKALRSLQWASLATVVAIIALINIQFALKTGNGWNSYVTTISVLRSVQVIATLALTYFMGRSATQSKGGLTIVTGNNVAQINGSNGSQVGSKDGSMSSPQTGSKPNGPSFAAAKHAAAANGGHGKGQVHHEGSINKVDTIVSVTVATNHANSVVHPNNDIHSHTGLLPGQLPIPSATAEEDAATATAATTSNDNGGGHMTVINMMTNSHKTSPANSNSNGNTINDAATTLTINTPAVAPIVA